MQQVSRARPAALRRLAAVALIASVASGACASAPTPPRPAPVVVATPKPPPPPPPLAFGEWRSTSYGFYLTPEDRPLGDETDLVFHFHVGRSAEDEYRRADVRAVVATATHGLFATAYGDPYSDPNRFPQMLAELELLLQARFGRPIAIRRIALVAWSAGYGAVRKLIMQPVRARIDAVVLLDGLHTAYVGPRWTPKVDVRDMLPFIDFAKDAADGKKLMVVTHTAIIPTGYASTTETADVLLQSIGVAREPIEDAPPAEGLVAKSHADRGDFHLRGYGGDDKDVHVAQLRLVDDLLREYLAPRWAAR